MTHETKMALHAELRTLGRKIIQGIVKGRDYSEFQDRFDAIEKAIRARNQPEPPLVDDYIPR